MKRTQLALPTVIALALVALAVAVPAAATADGAATAQMQANETANATPDATFDRDIYEVRAGEVLAIDVSLNHTDNATVVVGGQETEYVLRVTVVDGNDDGKVQLQFDTAATASTGGVIETFRDEDSVTVEKLSAPDREFVGSYGVTASFNGTTLDTAGMAVQEPETTASTTSSTTASTSTTTASMDPTDTTTSDGQPGFGVVAALAAVVAAAALVARH